MALGSLERTQRQRRRELVGVIKQLVQEANEDIIDASLRNVTIFRELHEKRRL